MTQAFLHHLGPFVARASQAHADDQQMLTRLQQLADDLSPRLNLQGLHQHNEVAIEAQCQMIATESQVRHWHSEWQQRQPMRQMSQDFADRFVLLVFGKVNAGKSTLINYLARELALALQVTPHFFQLQDGKRVSIPGPLEEGATETTSHIQGVMLGQHLVIIDTPGLHSVTPENAALTRRYTDAADAVIWLTPSTNPGLVHELNELEGEIRLGKPVLPVISRSDTVEETLDPVSGELLSRWVPKDPLRRQAQQQDVFDRACEHLCAHQNLLWQPVSLSVRCAMQQPDSDPGLPTVYASLGKLVQQATAQKGHKWQIQQEGFWQREVRAQLQQLPPRLRALQQQIKQQRQQLSHIQQGCQLEMSAHLTALWPSLVSQHSHSGGETALLASYRAAFAELEKNVIAPKLAPFFAALPKADSLLNTDALGCYKQQLIEYQVPVGLARKQRGLLMGSLLGGALGLFGGPIGALVGGSVGAWVGGAISGDIHYRTETTSAGVDTSSVLQQGIPAIEQDVQHVLERLMTGLTSRYLDPVANYCQHALTTLAPLCDEKTQSTPARVCTIAPIAE